MKVVWLVGQITEEGPRKLARELVRHHRVVSNMPDPSTEALILCISHQGIDKETWKLIEDNPQAKVVPALFNEGPILPALYADLRCLEFSKDFDGAYANLEAFIEAHIADR